jgi:hypothetical protein
MAREVSLNCKPPEFKIQVFYLKQKKVRLWQVIFKNRKDALWRLILVLKLYLAYMKLKYSFSCNFHNNMSNYLVHW